MIHIITTLSQRAVNQGGLNREEAVGLLRVDTDILLAAADDIRNQCCGEGVELCSIINGKASPCSEDCHFCAQSAHYQTDAPHTGLASRESIVELGLRNHRQGVHRFSIVTAGRRLAKGELEHMGRAYEALGRECGISLCASFGLLEREDYLRLRELGVTRIHNNLETSRRFFPRVCSTHSYDDKLASIRAARGVGLEVCSGGLFGMGETWEDRIDLALELRGLGVQSVPMNLLNPVEGTPLASLAPLPYEEYLRTIAIFRFILPRATLRLAGGRGLLPDKGAACFRAGANATISGDLLTTQGISTSSDHDMLRALGRHPQRLG